MVNMRGIRECAWCAERSSDTPRIEELCDDHRAEYYGMDVTELLAEETYYGEHQNDIMKRWQSR